MKEVNNMSLYLVQHGKCFSEDEDPERSLTEEGISEVRRIAEVARNYSIKVSIIKHSGKKRAFQTAKILNDVLKPSKGIEKISNINPGDDVSIVAKDLKSNEDIMIVGHLPHLEKLTSYLITGSAEKRVFKFQNGGIICLDMDFESWIIKWSLMPKID